MIGRAARWAGITLAILLVEIVIIELIFGNWITGPHLHYLTITRDVQIKRDVGTIEPEPEIATFTRDKHGLRGDYGGDPANIDIFVMGGSTTNELYVDDKKTWVAQLNNMLAEGGYKLKAINAGVDGHSSIAHIRSFEVWLPQIPRLKPKYFMFYIGLNEPPAFALETFDLLEETKFWAKVERRWKNNSALNNLFRLIRGAIRARQVRAVHSRMQFNEADMKVRWDHSLTVRERVEPRWRTQLDAYEPRARRLAQLTRQWGAIPIFVTQTRGEYRWRKGELIAMNEENFESAMTHHLFNEITMKVCREENGICIDLEQEAEFGDGDFYDHAHVNSVGSRKIAEVIYRNLVLHLPKPKP
jgi:hypothetical protein